MIYAVFHIELCKLINKAKDSVIMKNHETAPKNFSCNAGFTLTEVVIAGALLAIAVTGIFAACTAAIRTQHMSSSIYHATCLARNRIQRGLSLPFNTLPVLEDSDQPIDQDGNSNLNGPFRRTTELVTISDNCYKISVTIFYPIGNGKLSTVPIIIESKIARGMHSEEIFE